MTDGASPDWAALWAPPGTMTFAQARAAIAARELEELRSLDVDVDDHSALAAAYRDRELMAQLRGRQMWDMIDLCPDIRLAFGGRGFADLLRDARARLREGEARAEHDG